MIKKAITHIKIDKANRKKLEKLDELALEYQRVAQSYVDFMLAHEVRQPNKYDLIPEQEVKTPLSARNTLGDRKTGNRIERKAKKSIEICF